GARDGDAAALHRGPVGGEPAAPRFGAGGEPAGVAVPAALRPRPRPAGGPALLHARGRAGSGRGRAGSPADRAAGGGGGGAAGGGGDPRGGGHCPGPGGEIRFPRGSTLRGLRARITAARTTERVKRRRKRNVMIFSRPLVSFLPRESAHAVRVA